MGPVGVSDAMTPVDRRPFVAATSPSTFARIRRAVFARHSNPWSAWTRWATTPLVFLPVLTRDWRHAVAVGAWMALNPVIFPKPANDDNWATRAILGEERWITERPRDAAMAVQVVVSLAGCVAVVSAHRRKTVPTAAATATMMALTMVYWEQMARYHDRRQQADRR